jgi:hypothetical protein
MIGRRFLLLFLLTALLALVTSPLLAQGTTLSQTSQAMDAGLILSVSYPAGWVASSSAQGILIGSSQSALDELNKTGLVSKAGDVGVIVSLPNFLDNLSLPHDAAPADALNGYLQAGKLTGATITPSTDFSVPAATVVVTTPGNGGKAVLGALQFPNGTVIIGVVPDTALDATVSAIFNSITLEALPDIPVVTPDSSVSLKPASFNYLQPGASVTLSLGLPSGWVGQYSDGAGLLYVGNSAAALQKASEPGVTLAPGEVAITVALPHAVVGLGIQADSTPNDALSHFQTQTKALGRVVTDTTFGVPAAHAHFTGGNLPDGGGDVFAMKFDQGLVFIVIQPAGVIDGTVAAILQSIHLGELAAPVATQETSAEPTTQSSTGKTVTIPVTQPNGAFDLAFTLPDGWVEKPNDSGTTINMGSSADALQNTTAGGKGLSAGEIGVSIGLPQLITQLGLALTAAPEDTVNGFINAVKGKGSVVLDSSFSVPAVHGTVTADAIPGGSADLYALAFDGGTIIISVQPTGASSDALTALLQSIRFSPASGTTAPATPTIEATVVPTATPETSAQSLEQWASAATGTSEYGETDWSFAQMTGEPDTATCGDNGTAWASQDATGRAVVQLTFAQAVIPSQINVYQTFNPGAIVEIDVGNSSNPNKVLPLSHSVDAPGNSTCPGVFSLDVSGVDVPIDFVVIYIDQSKTQNWDEIDAVQLVGTPAS